MYLEDEDLRHVHVSVLNMHPLDDEDAVGWCRNRRQRISVSPDRVKNLWNPVISLRQRRLRPLSLPSRSMCTRVGLSWSGVVRTVWSPGKPPIGVSKETAVFCAASAPAPAGLGAVLTLLERGRGPELG